MSELDLSTPYATWVYLNRVVEGPSAALQALLCLLYTSDAADE